MLFLLCLFLSSLTYSSENTNRLQTLLTQIKQNYKNNEEVYDEQNIYFYNACNATVTHFPYKEIDKKIALLFRSQKCFLKNIQHHPEINLILKANNIYALHEHDFSTLFTCIDQFYTEIKNADHKEECTQKILYHLRLFLYQTQYDQLETSYYINFLQNTQKHIETLYNQDFQWVVNKIELAMSTWSAFIGIIAGSEFTAHSKELPDTYYAITLIPFFTCITRNALDNLGLYLRYKDCNKAIQLLKDKKEKDSFL